MAPEHLGMDYSVHLSCQTVCVHEEKTLSEIALKVELLVRISPLCDDRSPPPATVSLW